MLTVIVGALVLLHGLVHLLYFGQSLRLFELQPGLAWPEGSWAFSELLSAEVTRSLASLACIIATIAFVPGGTAILLTRGIANPLIPFEGNVEEAARRCTVCSRSLRWRS